MKCQAVGDAAERDTLFKITKKKKNLKSMLITIVQLKFRPNSSSSSLVIFFVPFLTSKKSEKITSRN
jgi:hypothetical protein